MKKFRILHFAQVPCEPFEVRLDDLKTCKLVSDILANQHLFLESESIIPDYSNVIIIEQYFENEWVDIDEEF